MLEFLGRIFFVAVSLSLGGALLFLVIWAGEKVAGSHLSKRVAYYLWILVLLRLVVPFSPENSLLGAAEVWVEKGFPMAAEQSGGEGEGWSPGGSRAGEAQAGFNDWRAIPAGAADGDAWQNQREGALPIEPGAQGVTAPMQNNILDREASSIHRAMGLLAIPWLLGAAVILARKVFQYKAFLRVVNQKSTAVTDKKILAAYEEILGDMGLPARRKIGKTPTLYMSRELNAPMLAGFRYPRIVLPEALSRQSGNVKSAETAKAFPDISVTLEHILRHELTHYKRGDIPYKWVVQVVCALHWFNPAVYALRRNINRDCELSCDEALCKGRTQQERMEYGKTLLSVVSASVDNGQGRQERFCTSMGDEGERLKERLGEIRDYRGKTRGERILAMLLVAALCAGSVLIGACGLSTGPGGENPFTVTAEEAALQELVASVKVDYEAGQLEFTVPQIVPEGYQWRTHVTGRVFLDDERTQGSSVHPFPEEESEAAVPGKTYTAAIDFHRMDDYDMFFSLLSVDGKEEYAASLRLSGFVESWGDGSPVFGDWRSAYGTVLTKIAGGEGAIWYLRDMDQDGTPELIGANEKDSSYYVYTFSGGEELEDGIPDTAADGTWGGQLSYLGQMDKGDLYTADALSKTDRANGLLDYSASGQEDKTTIYYRMIGNAVVTAPCGIHLNYRTEEGADKILGTKDDKAQFYIDEEETDEASYMTEFDEHMNEDTRLAPQIFSPIKEGADDGMGQIALKLATWDEKKEGFGEATTVLRLAEQWASALRNRNDKIRFDMVSRSVSQEILASASNPWVTGFSLRQTGASGAAVVYNLRTSAPEDNYAVVENLVFESPTVEDSRITAYGYEIIGDLKAVSYDTIDQAVSAALLEGVNIAHGAEVAAEGHIVLGTEDRGSWVQVYLLTMTGSYGFENGILTKVGGTGTIPAVANLRKAAGNGYTHIGIQYPMDGAKNWPSIQKMFPENLLDQVRNDEKHRESLESQEQAYAKAYLKKMGREAQVAGNIERKTADIPLDSLAELEKALADYPYWIGTKEAVENGRRYIYEKSYTASGDRSGILTYTKTTEDGKIQAKAEITIKDGVVEKLSTNPEISEPVEKALKKGQGEKN